MAYHVDPLDRSIVIDGFQNGIADSPYDGISDLRNINITSIPNEACVNFSLQHFSAGTMSGTLDSTDTATSTATITQTVGSPLLANKAVIKFPTSVGGSGIAANTPYMIKIISGGFPTYTVQLYTNLFNYLANTPLSISTGGTGTFTNVLSGTTAMGKLTNRWFDRTTGLYVFLDANGRVWITDQNASTPYYALGTDSVSTTATHGNGIAIYQGYIIVFRDALIDTIKISDGTYQYAWLTMHTASGTNNPHFTLLGVNDNILYYTDGNGVGSFFQKDTASTFDPADTNTYTATASSISDTPPSSKLALQIPSDDIAICLAELGTNLLIGGSKNAIYPWNRLAVVNGLSINNGYSYPILLAENFIQRMVTVNTNCYIFAGQRGRIYVTNGSQANLFKKVPDHISGTVEPYYQWGDACFYRNQLYFGVQLQQPNSGAIATNSNYGGLWAVDLDTKAIRLTNKLSFDTYSGLVTAILAMLPGVTGNPPYPATTNGVGLLVAWDSGASTFGIDNSSAVPYATADPIVDSDLIPIGTFERPRNATRLEYKLSKPLVTGESITLQYRLDFSQSWTTSLTDSTVGNFSLSGPINWDNAQWIQIRAILTSVSSGASYVRLKEIRISGWGGM